MLNQSSLHYDSRKGAYEVEPGIKLSGNNRAGSEDALIGDAIRKIRQKRGLSQADLGDALGISFQQVQKYERGVNRLSATRLAAVAKVLGCDMIDLMSWTASSGAKHVLLHSDDAMRLADAYDALTDTKQKRTLLDLALAMAASASSGTSGSDEE